MRLHLHLPRAASRAPAPVPVATEQTPVAAWGAGAGHDFGRVAVSASSAQPIQRTSSTGAGTKGGAKKGGAKKGGAKKGGGLAVPLKAKGGAVKKTMTGPSKTQLINTLADSTDPKLREAGQLLGKRSAVVWRKWIAKAEKRRKVALDSQRQEVNDAPTLFKGATPILQGLSPFQQMHAVTTAAPQAFKLNVGGTQVELDAAPSKKKGRKDGDPRLKTVPHLPTTFLDTGKNKSYDAMVQDPHTSAASQTHGEKLLPHLEVKRNPEAAFNVYAKDALFHGGRMTKQDRFSDTGATTFMEMKGATRPTRKKRVVQEASSAVVARRITDAHDAEVAKDPSYPGFTLGTQVGARPLADSREIKEALEELRKAPKKKAGKKKINRQFARIFRSATEIDEGSESEMDTDDEA